MSRDLVTNNHFPSMGRGFTSFASEARLPHVEVKGDDRLDKALGRVYEDASACDLKGEMDGLAEEMHDQFINKLNDICLSDNGVDPRVKSVTQSASKGTHDSALLTKRILELPPLCDIATKIARGYEEIGYEMDGGVAEYYLTRIHLAKAHLNADIEKIADLGDIVVEDLHPDILYLETLAAKAKLIENSPDFDRGNDL